MKMNVDSKSISPGAKNVHSVTKQPNEFVNFRFVDRHFDCKTLLIGILRKFQFCKRQSGHLFMIKLRHKEVGSRMPIIGPVHWQ